MALKVIEDEVDSESEKVIEDVLDSESEKEREDSADTDAVALKDCDDDIVKVPDGEVDRAIVA